MTYAGRAWEKHYVDVVAYCCADGSMTPLEIIWDDGRRFPLTPDGHPRRDRVDRIGGAALRYPMLVSGKRKEIYRDDAGWFVIIPRRRPASCIAEKSSGHVAPDWPAR